MPNFGEWIQSITGPGGTIKGVIDALGTSGNTALLTEIRDNLIAINQKAGAIREAIELPGEVLPGTVLGGQPYTLLNYLRSQIGTLPAASTTTTINRNIGLTAARLLEIALVMGSYTPQGPSDGHGFAKDVIDLLLAENAKLQSAVDELGHIKNYSTEIAANGSLLTSISQDYYLSALPLLQELLECSCGDDPDPDPDGPPDCEDCQDYATAAEKNDSSTWEYYFPPLDTGSSIRWYHRFGPNGWMTTQGTLNDVPVWSLGGEVSHDICIMWDELEPGAGDEPINRLFLVAYENTEDPFGSTVTTLALGSGSGCIQTSVWGSTLYSIQAASTGGSNVDPAWTGPRIWAYELESGV